MGGHLYHVPPGLGHAPLTQARDKPRPLGPGHAVSTGSRGEVRPQRVGERGRDGGQGDWVQGTGEDTKWRMEVTSGQMVNQGRLELEAVLDILLLRIRGLRVIISALLILGLLNV